MISGIKNNRCDSRRNDSKLILLNFYQYYFDRQINFVIRLYFVGDFLL